MQNRLLALCVALVGLGSCTPPEVNDGVSVTVRGSVSDVLYKTRIGAAEVCLIVPEDGPCVMTGFDGEFQFPNIPRNTRVMFRFIKNGYYPNMAHYTTKETEEFLTYYLTNDEVNDLAFNVAEVARDDNKSVLIFAVRTGKGPDATNVPDVTVTLSPTSGVGPFYAMATGLDKTLTATTTTGGGSWFNVEPGSYTLTYTHATKKCEPYYGWKHEGAENTLDVRTDPGFITYTNQICVD